jgi:hypothetical protein
MKRLFDLDATLIASTSSLDGDVAGLAYGHAGIKPAVNSRGRWEHFQTPLLAQSPGDGPPEKLWGSAVEDRSGQISLSMLGQHAPRTQQQSWDPNFARSRTAAALLEPPLTTTAIHTDGTPPIDVTGPGIDIANGVGTLRGPFTLAVDATHIGGDASLARGNDSPVQEGGADSILAGKSKEAARVTRTVVARLGDDTQTKCPRRES